MFKDVDGIVKQGDTVRQPSVMCDAGRALTSTLELERLLPLIARRIAEAVHASGCDLYEYRPSDGPVVVASWSRESHGNGLRREYLSIASDYARLLDGGRTSDCQLGDAGLPVGVAEAMSRLGDDRVLGVPLSHEEHVIGGLVVRFGRNGDAGVLRDDELLESLAASASLAMHNARLFAELEERNRRLSSLLESTRAISSAASVAESIRAAMADESVARSGQTPAGVTVSVEVAGYPDHGGAADRVLANADKALYLAKGLGKNRVEIYR